MAGDPGGNLRRARAALQRAAALAETPHDQCRIEAFEALLACETGRHEMELRHAQRLNALAPGSRGSLLWLRRAARCNRLKALEQQVDTALLAREQVQRTPRPIPP
jgi:hypothetical protein